MRRRERMWIGGLFIDSDSTKCAWTSVNIGTVTLDAHDLAQALSRRVPIYRGFMYQIKYIQLGLDLNLFYIEESNWSKWRVWTLLLDLKLLRQCSIERGGPFWDMKQPRWNGPECKCWNLKTTDFIIPCCSSETSCSFLFALVLLSLYNCHLQSL